MTVRRLTSEMMAAVPVNRAPILWDQERLVVQAAVDRDDTEEQIGTMLHLHADWMGTHALVKISWSGLYGVLRLMPASPGWGNWRVCATRVAWVWWGRFGAADQGFGARRELARVLWRLRPGWDTQNTRRLPGGRAAVRGAGARVTEANFTEWVVEVWHSFMADRLLLLM